MATTTATSLDLTVPSSGIYYARVSAVNAFGTSVASPEAETTVAIAGGRPGRTPRPRAWTSGRNLGMEWDAPIGGDPVTSYTLEVGTAPGLTNLLVQPLSAARSFSAGGVPVGTFWLRVRGANAMGLGDPSEDVGMVMGPAGGCVGLPLAPGALSATTTGPVVVVLVERAVERRRADRLRALRRIAPGRIDLVSFQHRLDADRLERRRPAWPLLRAGRRASRRAGSVRSRMRWPYRSAQSAPPEAPGLPVGGRQRERLSLSWSAPASGPVPSSYFLEAGSASGARQLAAFDTGGAATAIGGAVAPGRYSCRLARVGGATRPRPTKSSSTCPDAGSKPSKTRSARRDSARLTGRRGPRPRPVQSACRRGCARRGCRRACHTKSPEQLSGLHVLPSTATVPAVCITITTCVA